MAFSKPTLQIGINGRFFPEQWRPATEEIAFLSTNGFQAIQFLGSATGLSTAILGAPLPVVAQALRDTGMTAVMEVNVHIDRHVRTRDNLSPFDALYANLDAIRALPCTRVYWHLVPVESLTLVEQEALEHSLQSQLATAVALADENGFCFGLEHNTPAFTLFNSAARCRVALDAVPGLSFVRLLSALNGYTGSPWR